MVGAVINLATLAHAFEALGSIGLGLFGDVRVVDGSFEPAGDVFGVFV